jgi:hypothetical protein
MDVKKRAREIAHAHCPRCTGDTGYGAGGDGPRYHSKACDALADAINAFACDVILVTQGLPPTPTVFSHPPDATEGTARTAPQPVR